MNTKAVLLVAFAALAISSVAQADAITAVFTGNIVSGGGTDPQNLFGGGNLSGDAVTVTMSYNWTLLDLNGVPTSNDGPQNYGWNDGAADGAGTVAATIAGHTFSVTNSSGDQTYICNGSCNLSGGALDFFQEVTISGNSLIESQLWSQGSGAAIPNLENAAAVEAYLANQVVPFTRYGTNDVLTLGTLSSQETLYADLTGLTFTDTPDPTVPEPGTVTLTMLGASYLGARFRRRFQTAK